MNGCNLWDRVRKEKAATERINSYYSCPENRDILTEKIQTRTRYLQPKIQLLLLLLQEGYMLQS